MNVDPPDARPILEEDLHAYVDGVLDPRRHAQVQDYLRQHAEAAREVEAHARHRRELRAALAPIAEEPLPPSLNLARMVAEHDRQARDVGRTPSRRWPWGMAAALVLALGVGGGAGWSLRGVQANEAGGIFALGREAARGYETYASDASRPVEMGPAQRAELVGWVSSRLGRQVAIPDLAAAGYGFVGGRLVMTEHGPAGLFIYQDARATRLALMVRPMAVDQDTPTMKRIDGPHAGYAWADRGLGYGVVGANEANVLHPLADEMRRQIGEELKG
jgi:anti-sigma factor RsiW